MRECGLKYIIVNKIEDTASVTPLAGVWIEIPTLENLEKIAIVTPLAGVWIEIGKELPAGSRNTVTPLAGVWIEIRRYTQSTESRWRHSPCGSVD